MRAQVARRPFTTEEYHRMAEAGILSEDDRVELIEGETRHSACVDRLTSPARDRESPESDRAEPLDRAAAGPHPPPAARRFLRRTAPRPADVLLAVEVAETSGVYDRGTKLALYARARIPEVWIVDVRGDRRRLVRGQRLPSPVLPRTTFRVAEILG